MRLWKLLYALDLLLFGDLEDGSSDMSKTKIIAGRAKLMNNGNWRAVWNQLGAPASRVTSTKQEMERSVRRVTGLMEAGELSRAAAAAWGQGTSGSTAEVVKKLESTQPETPPQPDSSGQLGRSSPNV